MEIMSLKPFVILTLVSSILLASKSVCADESVMSNLRDWEHYDEYLKAVGHPKEKTQRSLNPEDFQKWGSKTIHKEENPILYKIPRSMPYLPLRFGRSFEGERNVEPVANLPLKLGRNFDDGISRRIPNLPQRFGRAAAKSVMESFIHLPQRLLGSPSAEQPSYLQLQELQAADKGDPRTLDFDDYFTKQAGDNEENQEEWKVWHEAPHPKVM